MNCVGVLEGHGTHAFGESGDFVESHVDSFFPLEDSKEKVIEEDDGRKRYTGEQRFYLLMLNVDDDHVENLIVPESVYYESKLGEALMSEDKQQLEDWGLDELEFSSANRSKVKERRSYLNHISQKDIYCKSVLL